MKCNKCNRECRIGTEQVGIDERNLPIIHRFSYCDFCKIKEDLDLPTYQDYRQSWFSFNMGLLALSLSILGLFTLSWLIGMIISPFALAIGIKAIKSQNIYKKSAIAGIIISSLCIFMSIIVIFQIIGKLI